MLSVYYQGMSRVFVLTTAFLLIIMSCSSQDQSIIKSIDAEELKSLTKNDIILLDVRTPAEYENGKIEGALTIDYRSSEFKSELSKLDNSKEIIVYCAAGGRSTRASNMLKDLGFKTIYNYTGGFNDWKARGEKIVK